MRSVVPTVIALPSLTLANYWPSRSRSALQGSGTYPQGAKNGWQQRVDLGGVDTEVVQVLQLEEAGTRDLVCRPAGLFGEVDIICRDDDEAADGPRGRSAAIAPSSIAALHAARMAAASEAR